MGNLMRLNSSFAAVKKMNSLIREESWVNTFECVGISKKMTAAKNIGDDTVHLSQYGVYNLMSHLKAVKAERNL